MTDIARHNDLSIPASVDAITATAVLKIVNEAAAKSILDVPSGSGWLGQTINFKSSVDGIDLFEEPGSGYEKFFLADLDNGIPSACRKYEYIVCSEGIEHFGNPLLFFKSAHSHLEPKGRLLVSTPNTWYPAAKLQYLLRGFFPSFPCLVGNMKPGTHMHIMPWSFPQLYLYLRLSGFTTIKLHAVPEAKPKRFYERILGLPQFLYCQRKMRKSATDEEYQFWKQAGSQQSILGRRLVVTASPASESIAPEEQFSDIYRELTKRNTK